jgi:SAM-dependent methyltransferase
MATTSVHRIVDGLSRRRRGPGSLPPTDEAPGRLAELDAIEDGWRQAMVRDARIDKHLRALLAQSGVRGGRVLEIGRRPHQRRHVFGPGFTHRSLDLEPSDEHTVLNNITSCPEITDRSYDVVLSVDVFERIDRPWLAAAEISRILAPGGLAYTSTLFSQRHVHGQVEFWRYTPEALEFLFDGLTTLDKGFDLAERRHDVRKRLATNPMSHDALAGGHVNVRVFHAGLKPSDGTW